MRISQINILKNYSVSSNKNNIRPTFINFKGIEDSFQSSLKDVKPSKAFLSAVEDKNQQEKIIRELLLDDKGNYDTKWSDCSLGLSLLQKVNWAMLKIMQAIIILLL